MPVTSIMYRPLETNPEIENLIKMTDEILLKIKYGLK